MSENKTFQFKKTFLIGSKMLIRFEFGFAFSYYYKFNLSYVNDHDWS